MSEQQQDDRRRRQRGLRDAWRTHDATSGHSADADRTDASDRSDALDSNDRIRREAPEDLETRRGADQLEREIKRSDPERDS